MFEAFSLGGAILGESSGVPDPLVLVLVVLAWSYLFNLLEYYFPPFRRIAEH